VVCQAWAEWIINPYRFERTLLKPVPRLRDGFFSVGTRSGVSVRVQLIGDWRMTRDGSIRTHGPGLIKLWRTLEVRFKRTIPLSVYS